MQGLMDDVDVEHTTAGTTSACAVDVSIGARP